jgi:hypothetical protein
MGGRNQTGSGPLKIQKNPKITHPFTLFEFAGIARRKSKNSALKTIKKPRFARTCTLVETLLYWYASTMNAWVDSSGGTRWHLDFGDTIRMNRMVQGGIDMEGFEAWYAELPHAQRCELAYFPFKVFICEKHSGGKTVVLQALQRMGRTVHDPIIHAMLECGGGFDPTTERGFLENDAKVSALEYIKSLSEPDLKIAFRFAVYLFGILEGQNFKACAGKCTHWWHQNLKDPAVVKRLLDERDNNRK